MRLYISPLQTRISHSKGKTQYWKNLIFPKKSMYFVAKSAEMEYETLKNIGGPKLMPLQFESP